MEYLQWCYMPHIYNTRSVTITLGIAYFRAYRRYADNFFPREERHGGHSIILGINEWQHGKRAVAATVHTGEPLHVTERQVYPASRIDNSNCPATIVPDAGEKKEPAVTPQNMKPELPPSRDARKSMNNRR